jgi:hypothetical protein
LHANDPSPLILEDVGATLQEQYAEDVFLELGCIHLAAEDVRSGKEVTFQLFERELCHLFTTSGTLSEVHFMPT